MRTRTRVEIWTGQDGITYRESRERRGSVTVIQRCRNHPSPLPLLKKITTGAGTKIDMCPECDYIAIEADTLPESQG
jgi:hypothetical protein